MLRLNRPLRRTSNADPEDVLGVKFAFHDLGYYDPPTGEFHPWPDAPLFEAIESFQVDNGLDADGEMLPGGPTESALNSLPTQGFAPAPNAYERAVAQGLVREQGAISDSQGWVDARRRQAGGELTPVAYRRSSDHRGSSGDILVPRNPFVSGGSGGAALGAALAAAALQSGQPGEIIAAAKRGAFRPSLPSPAPSLLEEGRTDAQAESRRRAALPPEKPIPPRDFDPEEMRKSREALQRPPEPEPVIRFGPLIFPRPEPSKPQILIFPDMSDEILDMTILESRWGNDKTKAELYGLDKVIRDQHKDWTLKGGVPYGKEYWFPGPGSAFEDKKGKRGDGRPGGRWGDLVYELPDGRLVVFQHADVDENGKIEQHELDAARAMSRPGVTVYIVPKQWQLERNRRKAERRENRQRK